MREDSLANDVPLDNRPSSRRTSWSLSEPGDALNAPFPCLAPIRILSLMALSIFCSEVLVMFVLQSLPPLSILNEAFVDAGMLLLFLTPTFYFFHYRPLMIHYRDRDNLIGKLVENEERLNLTLTATNDGLWDWDIISGKTYFSPRWETMLGYEPGEIEPSYTSWENLIHPDDRARVMLLLQEHLSGKLPDYEAELRLRTKSGDWAWVHARGKVVARDRNGNPLRALGTHTDIQSRKKAEQDLNDSRESIRFLSHQLIKNSEEEKKHLAQELHDEFGQLLSAFQLGVEMIQSGHFKTESELELQCARLLGTVDYLESDLRRICDTLRPVMLDDIGLTATLEWLVEQFAEQSRLQASFKSSPLSMRPSTEAELVLYRICQEALNNIGKHADATCVTVSLQENTDCYTLKIIDNGVGFVPNESPNLNKQWGMGLLGMNERAAAINGTVAISSTPGHGTTVLAKLPKEFPGGG